MSTNSSNKKIKIISQTYIPQTTIQQPPSQLNNDYKPHIYKNTLNSHTKFSVKPIDLNANEPNKQRSSSQLQNPLHPINTNLQAKQYEKSTNKGQSYCQNLNSQNYDFPIQISEKPQYSIYCQSYAGNNVENNSYNNSQCCQNQTQAEKFVYNKGYHFSNQNQQVYQQPIPQQCLSNNYNNYNNYNNNNNFESYQHQDGLNTQYQNFNQNQIQNYPTENQPIKQSENQSIQEVKMKQEQNKEYNSDNNCDTYEDLASSLIKSIRYQCKHCNTSVSNEIIQLDCYHFYHTQCFQDVLLQQIQVKTYRPLQCYCKIKISQSQVKNVLKLKQQSYLIEKLLESEIKSIFTMYKKIQNLNKCEFCDFFWVGDEKDKTQKTYYCQKCESKYQINKQL